MHRLVDHRRRDADRGQSKELWHFNCRDRDWARPNGEFLASSPIIITFLCLQLANAHEQIVVPLEHFRQKHIGGVKEKKKSFYKKTAKYCQAQERFLALSSKRPDNVVIEVSERERGQSAEPGILI